MFAYNAMPHSVTSYQPYELMFGHKASTVCNAWLGLAKYNDQYLQSKSACVNDRWTLKNIKQTAMTTVLHVGGSPLNIPKDNLDLLRDNPEGRHKIQDNYKSKVFVVVSKHKDHMSTLFVHCVGVWCIQSINDNCLT